MDDTTDTSIEECHVAATTTCSIHPPIDVLYNHHNDDTITIPTTKNITEIAPFSSKYTKNIQDYDTLRYMQLRYLLSDYEFVASYQWKCMQMAGWTYSNGIYKSPLGTRQYDNVNAMRHDLDQGVVRSIVSTVPYHSDCFCSTGDGGGDREKEEEKGQNFEPHQENMMVLRNDICYHMQLRFEQQQQQQQQSQSPADIVESVVVGMVERPNHPRNRHDTEVIPAIRPSRNRTTTLHKTSSVTAVEQGADLYLHRKQPPPRKRRTIATTSHNHNHHLTYPQASPTTTITSK